ncbi:hypothetical protein [Micromonospora sp. KLBMP9576]|uniref:hypothetical protein n=1 Tax=Micromonospora sp. KLBMP9576 TaxID=3424769 RepID=UPI003D93D4E3
MNPPSRAIPVLRAAAVALTVGVVAAASACTTSTPQAGDPTASSTAPTRADGTGPTTGTPTGPATGDGSSPSAPPAGANPILRGERQVVLRPIASFESILAVDAKGRLNLTDGGSDTSLFVLVPAAGDRHQIRTAKAQQDGEPDCLGLRDNGSAPTTVVATACDAGRAGQLFAIAQTKKRDEGRPTYTIEGEGGLFLRATDRQGLTAQRVGGSDTGAALTFDFVDNGVAPAGPGD